MATIEDKIKLFSKIVIERIQQEKQTELDEFELHKKNTIEKKKQALEDTRKTILHEASKKVQLRCNEIISREKSDNQSVVLDLKKNFINEAINEVRERLTTFSKSNEYKSYLIDLTEKTVRDIEKGDYFIFMKPEDALSYGKILESKLNDFEGKNFTIKDINEDIIGGIIVLNKSGKFRVNTSLALKLEKCIEIVGVKISEKIG